MNDLVIRPATPDDFDAIYTFVCGLEEQVFDKAELRQCYEVCLAAENSYYLIATLGNRPIGYISCHGQILMHHCGWVYEIQELYVLPEHRSLGVGKILTQAIEKILAEKDYKLLEVASNMRRTDAHRFYETNGFEKTSFKFKRVL